VANESIMPLFDIVIIPYTTHDTCSYASYSAMVFFMQPGFAMLCAGSIRAKNVKNVILWNLLDSAGGGLAFWAVGWAFAYGGDNDSNQFTFIGNTGKFTMKKQTLVVALGFFVMSNTLYRLTTFARPDFFVTSNSEVPFELWFFQFAFACALSSIVAGTIAERTQMKA
jgi:ammonium transporter, Amt family